MGFGTLFIGYFFLINISYYSYTDIIAAMIMSIGLYKLSNVNNSFRNGMISALCFAAFGLFEAALSAIELFGPIGWIGNALPYIGCARYLFIFILTVFIMRGISEVAKEVEADALNKSALAAMPLSTVFPVAAILELPIIADIVGGAATYIYFAVLLAIVFFILSNLYTIYRAYMQICMPEDNEKNKEQKSSVLDKFYDKIERGNREYTEYKLSKLKEKNSKNTKRKNTK